MHALVVVVGLAAATAFAAGVGAPPGAQDAINRAFKHDSGCDHSHHGDIAGYNKHAHVAHVDRPADPSGRRFGAMVAAQAVRFVPFFDTNGCDNTIGDCGFCKTAGGNVFTFLDTGNHVCAATEVVTASGQGYVMGQLIPAALAELSAALKVVRGTSINMPAAATCGTASWDYKIPAAYKASTYADGDIIVMVSIVPIAGSATNGKYTRHHPFAWGKACVVDQDGRPVVLHVNVNPTQLQNAGAPNALRLRKDVAAVVHQLTHALGFRWPFFESTGHYLHSNGSMVTAANNAVVPAVYSAAQQLTVKYLASPAVITKTRDFFGCQTLPGAALEFDAGGKPQHLEKRIFFEDHVAQDQGASVMTYLSPTVLAYFEDTGLFTVDYAAVNPRHGWLKGAGCTAVAAKCSATRGRAEFCFAQTTDESLCAHDLLSAAFCDVATAKSFLPSTYRYFADEKKGGSLGSADYCPFRRPYADRVCIDSGNGDAVNVYGSEFSGRSRCFASDVTIAEFTTSVTAATTRCFATRCCAAADAASAADAACTFAGQLIVIVSPVNVEMPCTADGELLYAANYTAAFKGTVRCPNATQVCSAAAVVPVVASGGAPTRAPAAPAAVAEAGTVNTTFTSGSTCASRAACAEQAYRHMPNCGAFSRHVLQCFASDCPVSMELFMTQRAGANCSGAGFPLLQRYCSDAGVGARDLCSVAPNGAAAFGVALAAALVAAVALLA
jgi:hypothetical protein